MLTPTQIGDTFVICDAGGGTVVRYPSLSDDEEQLGLFWYRTSSRTLSPNSTHYV